MSLAAAVVLAAVMGAAAYAGKAAVLATVVVTQVLLVAAWHRSLDAPGGRGGAALALVAGVGAAGLMTAYPAAESPSAVTGLLGAAVVAVFVHQLARRERSLVMASMSATGALVVCTVLPALYLPALEARRGAEIVAVAALAAAMPRATLVLGAGTVASFAVGLVLGAVTGLAGAAATPLGYTQGVAVGMAAAAAGHVAAAFARSTAAPPSLSAALPISLAAPVAYTTARLMSG